jgi:hypothetical protein
MTKEITPGSETSEHRLAIITMGVGLVISVGVSLGWINPGEQQHLAESIMAVIGGVLMIVPAVTYIVGRTWLKAKK